MEWKTVVGHEDYEVSDCGDVRRISSHKLESRWPVGRFLTKSLNDSGYQRVKIGDNRHFVHKIVLEAFVCSKPSQDMTVNHINGIKTDNRVSNLEWATRSENFRHAIDNGLWVPRKGEKHGNAKITEDIVRQIRATPSGTRGLAKKYGVDRSLIGMVRRGKIWSHVK